MYSHPLVLLVVIVLGLALTACNHDNQSAQKTVPMNIWETTADISFDSLRNLADTYTPAINQNDEQLFRLYEATQPVYDILGKIVKSSELVNSPNNNLNWYRVSNLLIQESGFPEDSVFNTIEEIISWYDGGNQQDLNHAAYMRQVMAHFHELKQFNDYLNLYPTQYREYELFSTIQSNLIDGYIEEMYATNHYSSLPMDVSAGIVNYLNSITSILKIQNALLREQGMHTASQPHPLRSDSDKRVSALLPEWKNERAEMSKLLSPTIIDDYDKITFLLENSLNSLNE